MNIKIEPMSDNYYKKAVKIAVEGDTDEKRYAQKWLKNYNRYFVALEEGRVVGEIGWYKDDGRLSGKAMGKNFPKGKHIYWVSHFAVDEKYRNHGIGKLLIDYIEQEVKRLGAKELWVYTDTARAFYEKHGFVFVQKAKIDDYREEVFKKIL